MGKFEHVEGSKTVDRDRRFGFRFGENLGCMRREFRVFIGVRPTG